jgi:aspartyl-tRNA(Asn)/glutamyl-tRNA(Gln) amidotransferase subunit B
MIGELFGWMNEHHQNIQEIRISPAGLVELLGLVESKAVNHSTARDILAIMLESGRSAKEIMAQMELQIISDSSFIRAQVSQVLADHPEEVNQYVRGKETLSHWFFGQVMSLAKGKADPALVKQEIETQLKKIKTDN